MDIMFRIDQRLEQIEEAQRAVQDGIRLLSKAMQNPEKLRDIPPVIADPRLLAEHTVLGDRTAPPGEIAHTPASGGAMAQPPRGMSALPHGELFSWRPLRAAASHRRPRKAKPNVDVLRDEHFHSYLDSSSGRKGYAEKHPGAVRNTIIFLIVFLVVVAAAIYRWFAP